MTTWTLYMQKPQTGLGLAPFAAAISSGITVDDSKYQQDPPAVGSNTTFPAGEQTTYIQKLLHTMQYGFEVCLHTRRGYRWSASSDGGATFLNASDS